MSAGAVGARSFRPSCVLGFVSPSPLWACLGTPLKCLRLVALSAQDHSCPTGAPSLSAKGMGEASSLASSKQVCLSGAYVLGLCPSEVSPFARSSTLPVWPPRSHSSVTQEDSACPNQRTVLFPGDITLPKSSPFQNRPLLWRRFWV